MNFRLAFLLPVIALLLSSCATPVDPPATNNAIYAIQLVSRTITPGWAMDFYFNGNTAYVADDEQGVTVWNMSDLQHPMITDTIRTFGVVHAAAYAPVTDMILCLDKSFMGGLSIYRKPTPTSEYSYFGSIGSTGAADFTYNEINADTIVLVKVETDKDAYTLTKMYLDREVGIWLADLSTKYAPVGGSMYGALLEMPYSYVAHGEMGLTIVMNSFTPFEATYVGNTDTPGSARDVALNRDQTIAYVADYQSGLQVIDVSDKSHPRIVGSLLPFGVNEALKVAAVGDTAIFTDKYNGIFAVDCSDPTDPRLIGIYDTPNPQGIFIRQSDKTIFLADQELGLLILKFRN